MSFIKLKPVDRCLGAIGRILELSFACPTAQRTLPVPNENIKNQPLTNKESALSAQLIRVNHSGEVCAQALYDGQAWAAKDPNTKNWLQAASQDESDHLNWCYQRLEELGSRTSYLNPLWYVGSFTLGAALGTLNDRISLGFVSATEHQVSRHLSNHLAKLPEADHHSRTLLKQMLHDEMHHAESAIHQGGSVLPDWFETVLHYLAKPMTTLARWI